MGKARCMQRQCRAARWKSVFLLAALVAVPGALCGCRAPKPGPPPRPAPPPPRGPPPRCPVWTIPIHCPPLETFHQLLDTHGRTWAHENEAHLTLIERGDADAVILTPQDLPSEAVRHALRPLPDA